MAIACALAVLALLSSPATLSTFSPNYLAKVSTAPASSQNAGSPYSRSSTENGTGAVFTVQSSTSTIANSVSSSTPTASAETTFTTVSSSSTAYNLSTPVTTSTNISTSLSPATQSSVSSTTLRIATTPTVVMNNTTVPVQETTISQTASATIQPSQAASEGQGLYIDARTVIDTVGIIAVVAAIVALGSMLYIKRRVDEEE
jgi:hypothetical protein